MNNTYVYNKKEFLKEIAALIEDDDIMIVSNAIVGTVSISTKKNEKQIPFGFAASAFKRDKGIGDVAFGKVGSYAFCVCKPNDVSDEAKKLLNKPQPK